MAEQAATDGPAADERVQGFLFSDLRGYTAYAEHRGDRAAADLLERYRRLVRRALEETGGAEIRTEGDSFYATFGSAGAAVRAGLAITRAAAGATADDPDHPIRPGVGVHVGEAAQGPEGPVGSAVNLAARLCAAAAPGEVLVSGTVRGVLRTSDSLAFDPRGRRDLKGIAEPIEVWAARPRTGAAVVPGPSLLRGPRPARLVAAGGAVLAAIAGLAVLGAYVGTPRLAAGGPSAAVAATGGSGDASVLAMASSAGTASPTVVPASPTPSGPGPFPNAAEQKLLATLPAGIAAQCRRGATDDDTVLAGLVFTTNYYQDTHGQWVKIQVELPPADAGVTCHPIGGASRLYVRHQPFTANFSNTDTTAIVDSVLGRFEGYHQVPAGSCATDPQASEFWTAAAGGSGMLACFRSSPLDRRPWIYFTYGGGTYIGFATRDDPDYAALYQWWLSLEPFLP